MFCLALLSDFSVVGVITNNTKSKNILLLVKTPTAGGEVHI